MSKEKLIKLRINEESKKLENGEKSYKGIRRHPRLQDVYCLYLEDIKGKRVLPIIIGPEQAISIVCSLANKKPKRPHTHDIFTSLMKKYKIKLKHIIIDSVKVDRHGYGMFHAKMFFYNAENKTLEIDSRTSDAIAMAHRFKSPIYTLEKIMKEAGYKLVIKKITQKINKKEEYKKTIKELEIELENCVKKEKYEEASKIRDEIKKRKK